MSEVRLPIDRARAVVLVDAVEAADDAGAWISTAAREDATRRARESLGESPDDHEVADAIARRAETLLPAVAAHAPAVARLAHGIPFRRLLLCALALPVLYGIGRSALGPGSTIDLFANPLVILVAWNAVVCAVAFFALILRALLPRPNGAPTAGELAGREEKAAADHAFASPTRSWLTTRLGEWLVLFGFRGKTVRRGDDAGLAARAVSRYASTWRRVAHTRTTLTASLLLHASASLLVAVAVGEAYLRGVFTEYEASWQSTWLDDEDAERLARAIYVLPAQILGTPLELPPEGVAVPAGVWIHRIALAALLFALIPRALLIAIALGGRSRTGSVRTPIDPSLTRRLRARATTRFGRVVVLPYSVRLPEGGNDRLRAILVEILGDHAVIEIAPPADYGDDPPSLAPDEESGSAEELCRVLLFGLAQPPEAEVHHDFLEQVARGGRPTIALVDASGYRRRFGDDPQGCTRIAERRRAWDRVLRGDGNGARGHASIVHVDLAEDLDDRGYGRLAAAVAAASGKEDASR